LNLRPSGYEAPEEGLQATAERVNPAESLGSSTDESTPLMLAEPSQHKNFGQPVVSNARAHVEQASSRMAALLTPVQAAARFQIPEYLLRRACSEGRLEHLRVVNALWLKPSSVAAFVESIQAGGRRDDS